MTIQAQWELSIQLESGKKQWKKWDHAVQRKQLLKVYWAYGLYKYMRDARLRGKQTLPDCYNGGIFFFNPWYVNIIPLGLIPSLDNQGGESKMKMSGSRLFQTWLCEVSITSSEATRMSAVRDRHRLRWTLALPQPCSSCFWWVRVGNKGAIMLRHKKKEDKLWSCIYIAHFIPNHWVNWLIYKLHFERSLYPSLTCRYI